MNSREGIVTALSGRIPDRLPVTTHHVMPYFLDRCMGGIPDQAFFDCFQLDAILWTVPHKPGDATAEVPDSDQGPLGFLGSQRVPSADGRVLQETIPNGRCPTVRYSPHCDVTAVYQQAAASGDRVCMIGGLTSSTFSTPSRNSSAHLLNRRTGASMRDQTALHEIDSVVRRAGFRT